MDTHIHNMESKRTLVGVTPEIHKAAKIRAAELGITITDAADQAFGLWLSQSSRKQKSKKFTSAQS